MTHRYTIGGVAFEVDGPLPDLDRAGYADLDLHASFVTNAEVQALSGPSLRVVSGPMEIDGAVDADTRQCWLPGANLSPIEQAWRLRQMAPVFSAAADRLVLHAGAVQIQGRVVAFVGPSGAGKSTLARFLSERGHATLADDLLPVRFDSAPLAPVGDTLVALAAVCFLERTHRETVSLAPLPPVQSLQNLIRHGFGEHGDPAAWQFQFDAYHRIVETTPGFDLTIPDDLSALPLVEEALLSLSIDPAGRPRPGGSV